MRRQKILRLFQINNMLNTSINHYKTNLFFSIAYIFSIFIFLNSSVAYAEILHIKGIAVDSVTRKSLDDVKIRLIKNDILIETQSINHITPFSIQHDFLKTDKYSLVARKEGYVDQIIKLSNAINSGRMPKQITISLGADKGSFIFKGRMLDRTDSAPVGNINITSTNIFTGEVSKKISDIEGNYSLNVLSGYTYEVKVHADNYLKRFAKIDYCGDTLDKLNKFCFSGFNNVSLNPNGGVSGASVLLDKVVIGKKFKVENIYYDYNKASLRKDAYPNLRKLLHILNDNKQITIELGSHADSRGGDGYNLKLSQRRADSAVNYIIKQGILTERIESKGYGETILSNHCSNGITCSDEEHKENRRTEFIIIDIDNSLIEN